MSSSVFQSIVNTLPIGMMIFDSDDNLIHSNNYAEAIFSDYFSEVIVISLSDLYEAINKVRSSDMGAMTDSFTIIRDSATLVFSIYPINDDDSNNFTAVRITNISGQKNNLLKQEKQVTDLLWKIRSRLTNLSNALEIISSGIEIDNDTKEELFNSSRIELFQIGRFVDNFRELTLINSNLIQESLEFEKVKLSDVVDEAIRNFNIYTRSVSKHCAISNNCLGNTEVFVDRYRTLRVIESLLLNAFIYSDNNVEIGINLNKSYNTIKLSITDNGWGIEDEDQKNIFSYTFRGKNAERTDHHGIGTELFLSRHILTKMNSEISFNSKKGEGSEFTIAFPNSTTGIFYL